jgi:hypothetical protein
MPVLNLEIKDFSTCFLMGFSPRQLACLELGPKLKEEKKGVVVYGAICQPSLLLA